MTTPGAVAPTDCAEDLAAVLRSLLDDLRFAELAQAVRALDGLRGPARSRLIATCQAGSRLLSLDAVGFGDLEGVSEPLRQQVAAMRFPTDAGASARGSLGSLLPLYELMLECLALHWRRGETAQVTLLLHLMAEYLPLLAWEPVLGHAGDPLRLREHVRQTLWATPACPAPRHRRSAAERVLALRVDGPDGVHPQQWRVYLDRWHARVAAHLRQCASRPGQGRPNPEAAGCDRVCGVVTALDPGAVSDLATRMALASAFADSEVVALRHAAPVGHFFGVPDTEEVLDRWQESRRRICRDWSVNRSQARDAAAATAAEDAEVGPQDGGVQPVGRLDAVTNPVAGGLRPADGEPLPGLQHLLSVVAARPVSPSTVLERLRDEVGDVLNPLLTPETATA